MRDGKQSVARWRGRWRVSLLRLAVLLFLPSAIGLSVNAARPDSLAWVAVVPYEIYADCPETYAKAEPITVEAARAARKRLVVDARPKSEFDAGHLPDAWSLPYDSLFPVAAEDLARIRDGATGRLVVVIGKGMNARLLADELAEGGLKGIRYLADDHDWRSLMNGGGGQP